MGKRWGRGKGGDGEGLRYWDRERLGRSGRSEWAKVRVGEGRDGRRPVHTHITK